MVALDFIYPNALVKQFRASFLGLGLGLEFLA